MKTMKEPSTWNLTAWVMNGKGGWKIQPVILIEGQVPFFSDHPDDYIKKLQEMHDDPSCARGSFHTLIGQFKDGLEQAWQTENSDAKSPSRNSHR